MAEANDLRALAGRAQAALTPHPHRGDLIAAGAVPLALGVLLVNVRLDATWGTGVFLVIDALACALVLGMGLLAPLEGERARSYQQVLLLAGQLLGFVTLVRLAQVLGADRPLSSPGSRLWIFLVVTVGAAWIARTRHSAVCVLVAALSAIAAAIAFVDWAFSPEGPGTLRWVLLALAIGLVLAALARRDAQRRESVYLIDAAGVAMLALGLTFFGAAVVAYTPLPDAALGFIGIPIGVPGGGWKLVLLAAGVGLVAYAGVDREAGSGLSRHGDPARVRRARGDPRSQAGRACGSGRSRCCWWVASRSARACGRGMSCRRSRLARAGAATIRRRSRCPGRARDPAARRSPWRRLVGVAACGRRRAVLAR